jgi:hypothetical protein
MYDDDVPVTPLEDWRTFWDFPEEKTDGPTRQEFEADEAITAAEWPQLGEAWMLALSYTAWDMIPHRTYSGGLDDEKENIVSVMIDSPALRSHLEMELDESRLRFVVVSEDELPVQALDVAVWSSLVTAASQAARSPKEFEWHAVIGAEPLGPLDPSDQRLVEAARLADLRLSRLDRLEEERGIAALERRNGFPSRPYSCKESVAAGTTGVATRRKRPSRFVVFVRSFRLLGTDAGRSSSYRKTEG